ncbi:MAG: hypothetical protein M3397_11515 [Actinomycetota bacterium]|nr:hypothetical protein [Actinomycetota bacterium]
MSRMHATESLAATVGHWIGTNAFRLMPTDPTYESGTGSQRREIEKRTTMNAKTTANYSADEAAIRDLFRALLDDRRGRGDGESRSPRSTEDGDYSRRAPDKRARFGALRGQSLNRNTHPI